MTSAHLSPYAPMNGHVHQDKWIQIVLYIHHRNIALSLVIYSAVALVDISLTSKRDYSNPGWSSSCSFPYPSESFRYTMYSRWHDIENVSWNDIVSGTLKRQRLERKLVQRYQRYVWRKLNGQLRVESLLPSKTRTLLCQRVRAYRKRNARVRICHHD